MTKVNRRGLRRARRVSLSLVLVLGLLGSTFAIGARATDLFTICGTVRDNAGRALPNVLVSYSSGAEFTDSSGYYCLGFGGPGVYNITADRSDLFPQTQSINVATQLAPVDWSLTYRLYGSLSPAVFNIAGQTLTLTATTSSPSGSCVSATVAPGGDVVSLGYISTGMDGVSTWSGTFGLSTTLPDGSYAVSYVAKECTPGTVLTNTASQNYVLDRLGPDLLGFLPDTGNLGFASAPLAARWRDIGGAGLSASTATITLTDETAGTSTTISGSSLTLGSDGWVRTPSSQTFVSGHVYRLSASINDRAGNSTSASQPSAADGGGFLQTSVTALTARASIPPSTCSLSDVNPATGTRVATCNNVSLNVGGTTVTVGSLRRTGTGLIEQTISLAAAYLRTNVAGMALTHPAYSAADPAWSPKKNRSFYEATLTSGQTVVAAQRSANLGQLLVKNVPATWSENVTLQMDEFDVTSSPFACANPLAQTGGCGPDPIANVGWNLWDPPVSARHVPGCDNAITHKEKLAQSPGAAFALIVDVDASRVQVSQMTLHYVIGDGSVQTQTASGTGGSSYSFTIPAQGEGTAIDYTFVSAGTFNDATCDGITTATSPPNHSFSSLVTADQTSANSALLDVANSAVFSGREQPALAGATTETVCTSFFSSPTPCEIFPKPSSSNSTVQTGSLILFQPGIVNPITGQVQGGTGTQAASSEATGTKIGPRTCRYTGANYYDGERSSSKTVGYGDGQNVYVAAGADGAFWGSDEANWSFLSAGIAVRINEFPQPTNIQVTFPWHNSGYLEADNETSGFPNPFGNPLTFTSEAHASDSAKIQLMRRDQTPGAGWNAGQIHLISESSVSAELPPGSAPSKTVDVSGTNSLQISMPNYQDYYGFIFGHVQADADGNIGASAHALADFAMRGHAWTDYQDWEFQMPAGWEISYC